MLTRLFSTVYKHNPYCIASVVLLWPGLVATIASTFILFASHKHDEKHGVFSKEGRAERDAVLPESKPNTSVASNLDSTLST